MLIVHSRSNFSEMGTKTNFQLQNASENIGHFVQVYMCKTIITANSVAIGDMEVFSINSLAPRGFDYSLRLVHF